MCEQNVAMSFLGDRVSSQSPPRPRRQCCSPPRVNREHDVCVCVLNGADEPGLCVRLRCVQNVNYKSLEARAALSLSRRRRVLRVFYFDSCTQQIQCTVPSVPEVECMFFASTEYITFDFFWFRIRESPSYSNYTHLDFLSFLLARWLAIRCEIESRVRAQTHIS